MTDLTQQQREALRLIEWMEFNAKQQKDWVARDSARYVRTYILNSNPNAPELPEALEMVLDDPDALDGNSTLPEKRCGEMAKNYRFTYTVKHTVDVSENTYREGDDPIAIEQDDARKAEAIIMAIEMGEVDIGLECEVIEDKR